MVDMEKKNSHPRKMLIYVKVDLLSRPFNHAASIAYVVIVIVG